MQKIWWTLSGAWSFLLGVALSFDCTGSIAARLHEQPVIPTASVGTQEQDIANLSGDWQRVGSDLRRGMESIRNEQK